MLNTGSDILNILIAVFVYSWMATIVFGVILSISFPIFRKTNIDDLGAFIPLYNVFLLCRANGYDEKMGLLFLIPGINIIMMMIMAYKLKDSFNTGAAFNTGLLLLPGIFIPVLAYSNYGEAEEEVEEEEETKTVPEEEPVDIDVDSIFKTSQMTQEMEAKPYKAKKVQVNEKFINSAPAKAEKIEKIQK